jgi:hypothetical protein
MGQEDHIEHITHRGKSAQSCVEAGGDYSYHLPSIVKNSFLQLPQNTNYDENQSSFYIRYRDTTLMCDGYLPAPVTSTT